MINRVLIILLIAAMPVSGFAQVKHSGNHKPKDTAVKTAALPSWAAAHNYDATAHVYFPDYYIFYDPVRGGYLFWNKSSYTFSRTIPPFLQKVDLRKSRIQILKGLSLDLHPEQHYPYYMKLYPPNPNNNAWVPVPIPGNPAGN